MYYLKQSKFFLIERSTSRVSGVWKVLHVTLFFAIATNFFLNSILLGRLFKSFQYNCILFCTNITFNQESLPLNVFDNSNNQESEEIIIKNNINVEGDIIKVPTERKLLSSDSKESEESLEVLKDIQIHKENTTKGGKLDNKDTGQKLDQNYFKRSIPVKTVKDEKALENNDGKTSTLEVIKNDRVKRENKVDESVSDISEVKDIESNATIERITNENTTVTFKNKTIYIYKNDIETIMVYSTLNLAKSKFPSGFWCNFTLCTALGTFVWALFFGVMMTMCSRGGKGYINDILSGPQNYLYWIVFISALFEVLNIVVLSSFEKGMATFCEEFEIFTGTKACSSSMDQFTVQFNQDHEKINFFLCYSIVKHTFHIGLALIGAQIIITILRILCVADYQLYEVQLEDKSQTETMKDLSRQNSTNVDTTTEDFASTLS